MGMNLAKQTLVVMKSKYRQMLKKYMTTTDRFAVYYAEYDNAICKLVQAHTKCTESLAMLQKISSTEQQQQLITDKVKVIERRIELLYNKKKEAEAKEAEYTAKIEAAVAVNEAMRTLNGVKIGGCTASLGDIIKDCDDMLAHLEAELKTLTFIDGLK